MDQIWNISTWSCSGRRQSADLRDLEKNMALLESIKPKTCRIALGIDLWGYRDKDPTKADDKTYVMGQPVPLDLMEHQCSLGLKWLKEGRVPDSSPSASPDRPRHPQRPGGRATGPKSTGTRR